MKRITFYANSTKPAAAGARQRLEEIARGLGMEVIEPQSGVATEVSPEVVVVLGGDGTMLSAVHQFPGIPLLGLNLGSLGYLAAVERPRFEAALQALAKGDYAISSRTALSVNGVKALNDVVVSKGVSGHAAVIELLVDGALATCFFADGLVIATPTGSTAYSLSAGGPILLPDSQSLVITPICPHALTSRPLVVRDTVRLQVRMRPRSGAESLAVFADGVDAGRIGPGECIEVRRSEKSVPLVQLEGDNPFTVLNRKLGWSGSSIG